MAAGGAVAAGGTYPCASAARGTAKAGSASMADSIVLIMLELPAMDVVNVEPGETGCGREVAVIHVEDQQVVRGPLR